MKKIGWFLFYFALIPFIASIPGLALMLAGIDERWCLLAVPATAVLVFLIFRKKVAENAKSAVWVLTVILILLMAAFAAFMMMGRGSIHGIVMANYSWLLAPFAPTLFVLLLMEQQELLYLVAFLTYFAVLFVAVLFTRDKKQFRKIVAVVLVLAITAGVSGFYYMTRPEKKYQGHGFKYMNGYSSTDFEDYTVYAKKSRLVTLDHTPELQIEDPADMPVLDGAEACYPVYAALAKAVYKDIDAIEAACNEETAKRFNGQIVSFTNSVVGFERLLQDDAEKFGPRIDMFFGARPSEMQLFLAKESGVEIEVTPIGREAFIFFVEDKNPLEGLTTEQIKGIYHGDISNWKDVGGKDQEIIPFQRPANSGSQTMMEYFMGDLSLREPKTYERVSTMDGVIRQVAEYNNEAGAMGYTFRYFLEGLNQEKHVKILRVDGVEPTLENIKNGSYPLTTNLCLITRKNDPNPNVQKMKEFILSKDGQEIIEKTGYAGLE